MRRLLVTRKRQAYSNVWPILETAGEAPEGGSGWSGQKRFAVVLTHDVDRANRQKKCQDLTALEENLGFRSSFNFVPERYAVSKALRDLLTGKGLEVGVHGLKHDGKLYRSKEIFQKRTSRINHYLKEGHAVGFHSPAMHHNLDWIHVLKIEMTPLHSIPIHSSRSQTALKPSFRFLLKVIRSIKVRWNCPTRFPRIFAWSY